MSFPSPSPKRKRLLLVAVALVAAYTIMGFFILPPIVRSQLQKRLSTELGRPVAVGKVSLNPYALSIAVDNLAVGERAGSGEFFGWRRLYARLGALSSLGGDWVLSRFSLDGFYAHIAVDHGGGLNFGDLLARANAPSGGQAQSGPSRPLRVNSFSITDARIDFSDDSRGKPFRTVIGPLTFSLTGFRTAGDKEAPYAFDAVTEAGEKFSWKGTILAAPVRSVGEFSVENVILPKYAPYYAQAFRGDIASGAFSLHGRYEINLDAKNRRLMLTDAGFQLAHLKIVDRANGRTAVELPLLEISGINADAVAMKAAVDRVSFAGGRLSLRREKDGTINLLALLPETGRAPAGATGATPAAAAPAPVDLKIGEVALDGFRIDIADLALPQPAQLGIDHLQLSLRNVTLAPGASMPLKLSFDWAPQGTVKLAGDVGVFPAPKAALTIDVAGLAILPLSPYVEQFVNARITQGAVSASGAAQLDLGQSRPAAGFTGAVKVEKFGLVDGARLEDLAGFSALALNGLKIATAPTIGVSIASVTVAAPYARVTVGADKSLNLAEVVRAPGAAAAPATVAAPPSLGAAPAQALPQIEIGVVTISDGDFSFEDRSLEPHVRMAVNAFGGTIAGLSSKDVGKADVDLKATVDGAGPVAISGRIDPLGRDMFVDLKVDCRSVDLTPLSPYSGKYAGYELARGKLFLDIKAKVAERRIDLGALVTLNQFTFGDPVKSPHATGLPVRLAVALLKDLDGKIVVDVPVEGSLDDPSFHVGKVVVRVIGNLLIKAAASPFSLLGSMFGGGGDELAYQEFAPGSSVLRPGEEAKLQTLVKALTNRPGLSLDFKGGFDAAADGYELKQQKLADVVRRRIWEARRAADPNLPPPAQLVITPEEHDAMVKRLFEEKFPPGTEFGAPLPKAPPPAPPPPAPKQGLFRRIVSILTFEGARRRAAEENARAKAAEETRKETAIAAAAGLPVGAMTARLAATMELGDDDLRALAAQRAERVRNYFLTTGKIAPERLFMAALPAGAAGQGRGPRVVMELR